MLATQIMLLPALTIDAPNGKPIGCKNTQYSEVSRFWELQRGTDYDSFALRGYWPISLALVMPGGIESPPPRLEVDRHQTNAMLKPKFSCRCAPRLPRA